MPIKILKQIKASIFFKKITKKNQVLPYFQTHLNFVYIFKKKNTSFLTKTKLHKLNQQVGEMYHH